MMGLLKADVKTIYLEDVTYPALLKTIDKPPKKLLYLGNIHLLNDLTCVAIIGSRRMSVYGYQVVEKLLTDLSGFKLVTVSGFTRGVDMTTHLLSIKNKIPTVAVLPCGIGHLMKSSDTKLIQKIVQTGGLILSEYDFEIEPKKWTFIARNRIVAGLARAVIVVEAAENSGSLLTADLAEKFDRTVFGVPGSIFSPLSSGVYQILNKYAMILVSGLDVGKKLKLRYALGNKSSDSTPMGSYADHKIVEVLKAQPLDLDSLAVVLNKSIGKLAEELFTLSAANVIYYKEGKYYAKNC